MTLREIPDAVGRGAARRLVTAALAASLAPSGCHDGPALPAPVRAGQEGVGDAPNGLGIVRRSGLDLPEYGLLHDDQNVYIRSFDPLACNVDETTYWHDGHDGFAWFVFLRIPAKELTAGALLDFADFATVMTESTRTGPTGWLDEGFACSEGPFNHGVSPVAEIIAADSGSLTIEVRDLCFIDYGPIEIREIDGQEGDYDDPSDDVVVDASGVYEISRCDISI